MPTTERANNVITLGYLGIIAYSFTFYWHELVGYGLIMRLLGKHNITLTAGYIGSPDPVTSSLGTNLGERLLGATGTLASLAAGLFFWWILKVSTRKKWPVEVRYGLWLFMAINLFLGSFYVFYSGVFDVASFADVIKGLPGAPVLRLVEIAGGAALSYGSCRLADSHFPSLPGSRLILMLVPYVSATIPYLFATLLMPSGWYIIIIGAIPAALLGQGVLPLLALFGTSEPDSSKDADFIRFSWLAFGLGNLCLLLITYVAPGVHFTL